MNPIISKGDFTMRMIDIIKKKRDGYKLTKNEIDFFIDGYTKGEIPDYQVSSLMMAIYFSQMDDEETTNLTMAMAKSGDMLDLSAINGVKVDKHSTGGVGDKTSLALTPLVASCGCKVAKMSGRGLSFTGGTIDKLESFPGFSTGITTEQFIKNVNENNVSIMGQTADLAPADKKLYALRDVTATVDNMSLIASSIMSKKLASGADAIVLDVKTGSGAFMKTLEDSKELAKKMVSIGNGAGRKCIAVISDMDQPLGRAVGNSLEVIEAIDTLNGKGPADFTKLVFTLGAQMLICAGICKDENDAKALMQEKIDSKEALNKLAAFIKSQGGDESYVYDTSKFQLGSIVKEIKALKSGYVQSIICDQVGLCSLDLGGGRVTKESDIDLSVGLLIEKKVGDYVEAGDTLAIIYGNSDKTVADCENRYQNAVTITDTEVTPNKLIYEIIR